MGAISTGRGSRGTKWKIWVIDARMPTGDCHRVAQQDLGQWAQQVGGWGVVGERLGGKCEDGRLTLRAGWPWLWVCRPGLGSGWPWLWAGRVARWAARLWAVWAGCTCRHKYAVLGTRIWSKAQTTWGPAGRGLEGKSAQPHRACAG